MDVIFARKKPQNFIFLLTNREKYAIINSIEFNCFMRKEIGL